MNRTLLAKVGLAAALAATLAARPAAAQTYTWTGATALGWNDAFNWSPLNVPNSPTANVNFTGLGPFYGVNISANVSAEHLTFSNPTLGYTLTTSNAGVSLNGVVSITVAASVTVAQSINLFFNGSGNLLFPTNTFLSITNSSTAPGTTLAIGPNTVIGTPGLGGVIVDGSGTTLISGSFASIASGNSVVGGLYKNGTGTLILSNPTNSYGGGTYVNAGTLMLGSSTAIPTGTNVTVAAGAQFSIGSLGNSAATAIGEMTLNGGKLHPSGRGEYYLNKLTMTGGTVEFTGVPDFWLLHLTGNGAAITTNASSTTASWIGSGISRIQNETASPLVITVNAGSTPSGIDLDAGIILSSAGTNPTFVKSGAGTMRLTYPGNTANIIVGQGRLRVDDMATNGYGVLAGGTIFLSGGVFQYGGPSATSNKPFSLYSSSGSIQVLTPAANLQLNGVISELEGGSALIVSGPGAGASSTLTMGANHSYSGPTTVAGNAVLAISGISIAGFSSPIGTSSAVPGNLLLGNATSRGTLLLTGGIASTNRGASVFGLYASGAGGAIGVQNANTNLTVSGQITGSGSLIKTGAGTLSLTGITNNYTGGTYVEQGTLNVGATGAVIPANSNVTVSAGATFLVGFPTGNNFAAPLGTMTLNGGTLRVPSGDGDYYLNKLVMTGGTVDFTGSANFSLRFINPGAAIVTNSGATTANLIGTGLSRIWNENSSSLTVTVAAGATASGIDLDAGIVLINNSSNGSNAPFVKAGFGTLRLTNITNSANFIVQQGALRVDDVNTNGVGPLGIGTFTLNGGRLAYGGATATLSKPFAVDAAGGTLEVLNAGTTLTVTSPITSNGLLTKSGPGALILSNPANNYAGGIAVSGGRFDVSNDTQLGQAAVAVHPFGTLRYTATTTTARTFNLPGGTLEAPAGVTLTLNGATVAGGYLRGAGTFGLTGGTILSGATTFNSTTINQTGPATLANVANGGTLTNASGSVLNWNGGGNASSGVVAVTGTTFVGDWSNNGRLAVNPGGMLSGSLGDIVLGGGSVSTIGTYNPVNGQVTPGGTLKVVNGDLRVQGGFVRNNGTITGTGNLIIDYGGLVKGAGDIDLPNPPIRLNGGQLLAGNSPGLTRVSAFSLVSSGVTGGDFSNATGTAGPPIGSIGNQLSGHSVFEYGNSTNTGGSAQVQGTPAAKAIWQFRTVTDGGDYSTAGVPANFNAAQSYTWPIVRPRSNADAVNPTIVTPTNTVAQITILDTATMSTVPLNNANLNTYLRFDDGAWNWGSVPVDQRGTFGFALLPDALGVPDRVIAATYTPVPEPVALVLMAFGGMLVGRELSKRKRRGL